MLSLARGGKKAETMEHRISVRARCFPTMALLGLFMLSLALPLAAQGPEFQFNGIRFNNAILGFMPVPVGVDLELHVPLNSDGLFFSLRLAGGYEDRLILRNDADGSPLAKPVSFDAGQWFYWPNAEADTGLLYRPDLEGRWPGVEIFALARGRYEENSPGLGTAVFPDASGLLALSCLAGLEVSTVEKSPRRQLKGYSGEISAEWAPQALGLQGGCDFFRLSANLEGYLPLFSVGEDDRKAISAYAGAYATADLAWGDHIPLYVLTSFGGRYLRNGLGSSVRGFQPWGYEAATKAATSLELRLVGPGLFGMANLRPMTYLFVDAGYFARLYASPGADKEGFLASAGGAVAFNILDFAYLGLRAGIKYPDADPLHDAVYFTDKERFFWNVTFLLHF